MAELVLLQCEAGAKNAMILCPVCNRISWRQLASPYQGSVSAKLLRSCTCPICGTWYDTCDSSMSAQYEESLKRFIDNSSLYTKSITQQYASKQKPILTTPTATAGARRQVQEKRSKPSSEDEVLDQKAISSETMHGSGTEHEYSDDFSGQVTRGISTTGSKISAGVSGRWSKISGTSADAAEFTNDNNHPKEESLPQRTIVADAKSAASIVSAGIESGDYAGIEIKLREIIEFDEQRTEYVFPFGSLITDFIFIAVCFVFSAVFLYLQLLSLAVAVYSETYRAMGIAGLGMAVVAVIINIAIIIGRIKNISFSKRYATYANVLQYRGMEIVEDLASMVKVKTKVAARDLEKAIKSKLIPQGHFGRNGFIFMISDEMFADYSSRPAVYDHYYKKRIEERERMKSRAPEVEDILVRGKEYIRKIHDSNDLIKDRGITEKLNRMEQVVSAIFHEVDVNPGQASKLGMLMSYYLPTTEKLLESYIEIDEKRVKGNALKAAQDKISRSLDTLNRVFEALLERFYKEQATDVAGDIFAMEIIMKQEGLEAN